MKKYRLLLIPTTILGVLLVVLIFVLKFGVARIDTLNAKLVEAEKKENLLQEKLNLLQTIDPEISSQANLASQVLPGENSVLAALYQLKALAASKATVLTNLKIGAAGSSSGLSQSQISFQIEGSLTDIVSFVSSLKKTAPLVLLDKINLRFTGGLVSAEVRLKCFWASFPTKMPAVTDATNNLTSEEQEVLGSFADFSIAPFGNFLPTPASFRDSPF